MHTAGFYMMMLDLITVMKRKSDVMISASFFIKHVCWYCCTLFQSRLNYKVQLLICQVLPVYIDCLPVCILANTRQRSTGDYDGGVDMITMASVMKIFVNKYTHV
jgi:hypothetical protein